MPIEESVIEINKFCSLIGVIERKTNKSHTIADVMSTQTIRPFVRTSITYCIRQPHFSHLMSI